MKSNLAKKTLNIAVPFLLGGAILWWMYRDFDFHGMEETFLHGMDWGWMLFSLVFGVTAQMFRGIRWKQTLEPMGERPSTMDCIHAVFISYASSLIIPRSGEISRCGILAKYDNTNFAKAVGTVVTERIIDSLLLLAITAIVILSQITIFDTFFDKTGVSLTDTLRGFTTTGYIVTAICLVVTAGFLYFVMRKFTFMTKIRQTLSNVKEGILSLKRGNNKNFGEYTGKMLAQIITSDFSGYHFDCVMPVPMSENSRRKRGYNQAEIIASEIADALGIPVVNDILFKKNTDSSQHYLKRTERMKNITAIKIKNTDLGGKNVIICDDVITTGSTVNRCAQLLKSSGAGTILLAAAAESKLR